MPKAVIFVHGCFWHGHRDCPHFRLPKTRNDWWRGKIARTQQRDWRNEEILRNHGWNVLIVWECQLRTVSPLARLEKRLIKTNPPRLATKRAFPSQEPWLNQSSAKTSPQNSKS